MLRQQRKLIKGQTYSQELSVQGTALLGNIQGFLLILLDSLMPGAPKNYKSCFCGWVVG